MVDILLAFLIGFIGHSLKRVIAGVTDSENIRELAMETSGTAIVIGCGALIFERSDQPRTWREFLSAGAISAIAVGAGVAIARLVKFSE